MSVEFEFKNCSYIKTIESKEAKRPTHVIYIPLPDSEPYCYYRNNAYEDEGCDGNWCVHCSCPEDEDCTVVSPWHSCDKFCRRQ